MTTDDINEILEKLREVEQGATEGPWERRNFGINEPAHRASPGSIARAQSTNDARFIALARTALPALMDAVEQMAIYVVALRAEDSYYSKRFDCSSAADDIECRINRALAPLKELLEDKP